MLSRRVLLGGAALAALAGCGILPGTGTTTIAPAPDPGVPGHQALHRLRAALDHAASGPLTLPQADLLAWARDVNDDQFRAVSLATLADVGPPPSLQPSPAPGATAAPAAPPAGLAEALAAAQTSFRDQALDATIARPLVWASMAAWCAALSAQLPDAAGAREPARGVRLPAPQEPGAAAQAALDAAAATVYGLEVAAGALGLGRKEQDHLRTRITFWSGLREELAAGIAAASATPTPAPPWYAVGRPSDAAAGRALAARLQASALPVLGRTLANGPESLRPLLVDALGGVAADVPRWGGLLERWPGLPAT